MKIFNPVNIQNLQPQTAQQLLASRRRLRIIGAIFMAAGLYGFYVLLAQARDFAPHSLRWLSTIIGPEQATIVLCTVSLLIGVLIFSISFLKAKYPAQLKKMR
jgi:fructose-specific phosphotransferase system IIC component